MADLPAPTPTLAPPKPINRHIFAVLAVVALGAAVGLWYVFNQTSVQNLKLGAGMELRYHAGLTDILCEEAKANELTIEIQWNNQARDVLQKVNQRDLDAAIIPAALSAGTAQRSENIRQVTMLDCQTLHLFVKPEINAQGLAGLRGHSIFMGQSGTEVRGVAEEILKFIGLTGGQDFTVDERGYAEIMKSPTTMPDAIFGLSPLPSPLGEKLVRQFGYQLMELPMGAALSLRRPCYEDILIPAETYGVSPAVPQQQVHSIGVRGVLIANKEVPSLAVERLLEVFYEGDFARRANIPKLDPALLQRSGDYPAHAGTFKYIHRTDPWPIQKLLSKVQGLIGSVLSVFSAILLAYHWIRRKKVDVGAYQQECTHLDLDAQRAAYQGEFGDVELSACLTQLARLKAEVLEQFHQQYLGGDKDVIDVVTRIEGMQTLLPTLVRSKAPVKHLSLEFGPPRKVA